MDAWNPSGRWCKSNLHRKCNCVREARRGSVKAHTLVQIQLVVQFTLYVHSSCCWTFLCVTGNAWFGERFQNIKKSCAWIVDEWKNRQLVKLVLIIGYGGSNPSYPTSINTGCHVPRLAKFPCKKFEFDSISKRSTKYTSGAKRGYRDSKSWCDWGGASSLCQKQKR